MQRTYWTVMICGATILTIAVGMRASFGLFLLPISFDLAISREMFAFGIALQNLLWGAASPFTGLLADRYGEGRTAAAGGIVYGAGLLVLATSTGATGMLAANVLIGFALAATGFATVFGAVARATPPERRSFAMGLVSAGGSFGQFAMVPLAHVAIDGWGWVTALLLMAGFAFTIAPLAAGIGNASALGAKAVSQRWSDALAEAGGHRGFWLLTAGFFVCGFQVVFVGVHLPAYLADRGLDGWVAAWALAIVGLFNIVGTLGAGWLGGRYRKKYLLAGIYFARAMVFLVFMITPLSPASVLIFAAVLGLLWLSTVPLTSGLVAQIFGPAYMSMLYGIVFFGHQVGSFFGAWLGGYVFDLYGSYDPVWWMCVALGLAATLLHWPIPDRPVERLAARPA